MILGAALVVTAALAQAGGDWATLPDRSAPSDGGVQRLPSADALRQTAAPQRPPAAAPAAPAAEPPLPTPAVSPQASAVQPTHPSAANLASNPRRARQFFNTDGAEGLLFWTHTVIGGIAGGISGARLARDLKGLALGAILGAFLGALGGGTLGLLYNYFAPENAAPLAGLILAAAATALIDTAITSHWDPGKSLLVVAGGIELSLLGFMLATLALDTIKMEDVAFIGATMANATYVTALTLWLVELNGQRVDWRIVFMVPAISLVAAGALSFLFDIPTDVTLSAGVAGIGLSVMTTFFFGTFLTRFYRDGVSPTNPTVALATWAGGFALGLLGGILTSANASSVSIAPLVAPTPDGSTAYGAVMSGRF